LPQGARSSGRSRPSPMARCCSTTAPSSGSRASLASAGRHAT
jgi:hypothetical protein